MFMSSILLKLESRIQSIEIKIISLNKIVTLMQHYTEKKD